MRRRAMVAGASRLIGRNLIKHIVSKGWEVYGIGRKPSPGVRPIAADMFQPKPLKAALDGIAPSHVFFTTWVRRPSEDENIAANAALVRNVLGALVPSKSVQHAALVTSLKHYLGPFEHYAKVKPNTPLREEMPRLPFPNFFYAQEDALFEAAQRQAFSWSMHRSHTKLASAWNDDMDLGREIEVVTDMTKSRLAGFHEYQPTLGSFLDLFSRRRRERIIPAWR